MSDIPAIGKLGGLEELSRQARPEKGDGAAFSETLKSAIATVDGLQKESEAVQSSFAKGEKVELHDVLIKVEEAEIAFRAMMEVRNKLIEAYQQVMRMGSGG